MFLRPDNSGHSMRMTTMESISTGERRTSPSTCLSRLMWANPRSQVRIRSWRTSWGTEASRRPPTRRTRLACTRMPRQRRRVSRRSRSAPSPKFMAYGWCFPSRANIPFPTKSTASTCLRARLTWRESARPESKE